MFPHLPTSDGFNETADDHLNESRMYNKVLRAFLNYPSHTALAAKKRRKDWCSIPAAHRALAPGYGLRLDAVDEKIKRNGEFLRAIVMAQEGTDDINEIEASQQNGANSAKADTVMESDMDKVRSTLRQFVRDWSEDGRPERDATYKPILDALKDRFKDVRPADRGTISVLVPGAGLGRLCYDIVAQGFTVQGNEFSFYMLLASNFILNTVKSVGKHEIFPWIHTFSNQVSGKTQAAAVKIPDIVPEAIPAKADFSMVAGDFLEVYSHPDQLGAWDVIVTCYFIDTAKNIIHYLEVISKALKAGGTWINLGPLLYHFEGMKTEISIDLSLDEVKDVAKKFGFVFEIERVCPSTYSSNPTSMLKCEAYSNRKI
ncbi:hypothetical protein HK101_006029 [Irineochytrium annulatum]|nr:hypothetical protein HK101_006029 [Irineochytrium annulatum]